jgi:TfoX/Sxy family transcriptional regulator of competence genes
MRAPWDPLLRGAVCTIVAMAYDEKLVERIRQLIGSDPELTEKKMFGGLAFLIRGNMAIAASSEGGAMVRVDPAQSDSLVATTKATLLNMRGQDMPGWLHVSSGDLRTDDQLAPWVEMGTGMRARCRPSSSLPDAAPQPPADSREPAATPVLVDGVDGRLRRGLVRAVGGPFHHRPG